MATNAHRLVYRDNFTMGGGAYRLVFTVEPHPHDGDWWTVFHARAAAVGLTSQVLELLDDGQAATLNVTVGLDDGERVADSVSQLVSDTDREFHENVLPARREAEARAQAEAERVARRLDELDHTLRGRFAP
jgi:hypothetical protein